MSEFKSLFEALSADGNFEKSLEELASEPEIVGLATAITPGCIPFPPAVDAEWPSIEIVAAGPLVPDSAVLQHWAYGEESPWPKGWAHRIAQAYRLVGWDGLSIDRRQYIAKQDDANRDPALATLQQRGFRAGYHGIPVESVRRPMMWTVPMCCAWIATRDVELVEQIWLEDEDSADWLNNSKSLLNIYDAEVLSDRSRLLRQAGHEPLPSAGASLACLQDEATRGNLVERGQPGGRGESERIPTDAWANLHIVPSADGYQAQPMRQHHSSPWWSGIRVPEDEVRKVWPDVPKGAAPLAEIGSPRRRSASKRQKPSRAVIVLWYKERVKNWPTSKAHPSRDDDVHAAQAHFERNGLRTMVRKIRSEFAPPEWTADGPKGDKRPVRSRVK